MSNSYYTERLAIRLTPEQLEWVRSYAKTRGFSLADALREVLDEQMAEKPHELAALRAEVERYGKAFMDLAHASGVASEMFAAGTAQAVNRLKSPEGLDRLKAVGE